MSALETPALFDPFVVYRGGIRELVQGASPAAGADFTQAMDGRYLTRLLALHVKLVADANAASREVVLEYRNDQGLRFALAGAATTVVASATGIYEFNVHQAVAEWTVDGSALVPLSPLVLPAGFNFRVHVVNVQAGDQLSELRWYWERFYTDELR